MSDSSFGTASKPLVEIQQNLRSKKKGGSRKRWSIKSQPKNRICRFWSGRIFGLKPSISHSKCHHGPRPHPSPADLRLPTASKDALPWRWLSMPRFPWFFCCKVSVQKTSCPVRGLIEVRQLRFAVAQKFLLGPGGLCAVMFFTQGPASNLPAPLPTYLGCLIGKCHVNGNQAT